MAKHRSFSYRQHALLPDLETQPLASKILYDALGADYPEKPPRFFVSHYGDDDLKTIFAIWTLAGLGWPLDNYPRHPDEHADSAETWKIDNTGWRHLVENDAVHVWRSAYERRHGLPKLQ